MAQKTSARGFAPRSGGMIRGPGTGTSDSIATHMPEGTFIMPADSTRALGSGALQDLANVPVRVSNGEFQMTPEQVHAVGVAVLSALKDATHTPVGQDQGGEAAAPQALFGGGIVKSGGGMVLNGGVGGSNANFGAGYKKEFWDENNGATNNAGNDFVTQRAQDMALTRNKFNTAMGSGQKDTWENERPNGAFGTVGGSLGQKARALAAVETENAKEMALFDRFINPDKASVTNNSNGRAAGFANGGVIPKAPPWKTQIIREAPGPDTHALPRPSSADLEKFANGGAVRAGEYDDGRNSMGMYGSTFRGDPMKLSSDKWAFANGGAVRARGFIPFADGGEVAAPPLPEDDPRRNPGAAVLVPSAYTMAPAPNSPSNTFPGNRLPDYQGGVYSGKERPQEPTPQGLNAHWASPEYARAAQQSDKSGLELESDRRANATANDPIKSIALTGTSGPSNAGSSSPERSPKAATLNSALEAQRRRDAINGAGAGHSAPAEATTAQTEPTPPANILPGVYRHGKGQYSDNATGVGFSPHFTGVPSAKNDAIAESLSERSRQESLNRLALQQYQREVEDAQATNAASSAQAAQDRNSYAWMNDLLDPRNTALRNASVGSTIFRDKNQEMMANNARQARVARVWDAINSQMHDAQQAATTRYQSDNSLAGSLGAEQVRQDGENRRADRNFVIDQQKQRLEADKAAQKSTERGFDIRAAQRKEGILQRYDAAKSDQERGQIQSQYPDVFGREKTAQDNLSNNFMRRKVPVLDAQGRPTGTEREEIVDLRTGRELGAQAAGMPAPKDVASRVIGQTYISPNGKPVTWNGKGWIPA